MEESSRSTKVSKQDMRLPMATIFEMFLTDTRALKIRSHYTLFLMSVHIGITLNYFSCSSGFSCSSNISFISTLSAFPVSEPFDITAFLSHVLPFFLKKMSAYWKWTDQTFYSGQFHSLLNIRSKNETGHRHIISSILCIYFYDLKKKNLKKKNLNLLTYLCLYFISYSKQLSSTLLLLSSFSLTFTIVCFIIIAVKCLVNLLLS